MGHAAGGEVVKVEGETVFYSVDFTDLGEMAVATQENGGSGIRALEKAEEAGSLVGEVCPLFESVFVRDDLNG